MIKLTNKLLIALGLIIVLGTVHSSILATSNPFQEEAVIEIKPTGDTPFDVKIQDEAPTASITSVGSVQDSQKVSGMYYYTVKPGDYLSKICQQFYGNSGMWTEILKYQIPSIVSNPNLIFAGQLIALPREIAGQIGNTNSLVSGSLAKSSSSFTAASTNSFTGNLTNNTSGSPFGTITPCQPMPNRISSDYGMRIHPITGEHKKHNGVDLPIPNGTRLNALADGVVTKVGYESAGGKYVKVQYPGGYESIYCHLQDSTVSVGQTVKAGQQVALSDNSGGSTGPHLHLGLKKNGTYIDPDTAGVPLP